MVIQLAAAFFAAIGFAVLYGVPLPYIAIAGAVGCGSWGAVIAAQPHTGTVVALLIGAALAAGLSEWLARRLRQPTTLFLIPGMIPLVPGGRAYMTMLYFLQGDTGTGIAYLMETLFASGAIAVGIILIGSLFRIKPAAR